MGVSEGAGQPDFFFLEAEGGIEIASWDIGRSGMQGEMTQPALDWLRHENFLAFIYLSRRVSSRNQQGRSDAFEVHAERGGDEFGAHGVFQVGEAGAAQHPGEALTWRWRTSLLEAPCGRPRCPAVPRAGGRRPILPTSAVGQEHGEIAHDAYAVSVM
jgi:hypothetical protein